MSYQFARGPVLFTLLESFDGDRRLLWHCNRCDQMGAVDCEEVRPYRAAHEVQLEHGELECER